MTLSEKLAKERRARLAAERLLEYKQRELFAANEKLALHARALSDQIVQQRQAVTTALTEAEELKGQNSRFLGDLERAHTAAVMAERRLWDSVEAVPDGFAVFDADLRLVSANRAFRALFTLDPGPGPEGAGTGAAEASPGPEYAALLHGLWPRLSPPEGAPGPPPATEWVAGVLAAAEREAEAPVLLDLGGGLHVRLLHRRARDGDLVALAIDISAERAREAELEEARHRAEAASRAKSAFLANMSHEIRTPMNGVVGMADLLCDTRLSQEQRLYAETIRSSGEALLVIIDDILDYSRIGARQLALHPRAFDLAQAVHEVARLMQPAAQAKGLTLSVGIQPALSTRLVGDPGRIRQILGNLVGNAVKFTEAGRVALRVTGQRGQAETHLQIAVEDTGIGLTEAECARIFDEFTRIGSGTGAPCEGTGLGLAITRRLVEGMGGSIQVESQPGTGSCFTVRLCLPVAAEEPAPAPLVPVPEAPPAPPPRPMRLLAAEDNRTNQLVFRKMIKDLRLELSFAANGREAVTLYESLNPDLIFMDISMPEMDGCEAARAIRRIEAASGRHVPIVALTAHAGEDSAAEILAAGIDRFLTKPLRRAAILQQIAEFCPEEALPPIAED